MVERIKSLEVKGLVLAGGKGTRLYPLTAETNKHLLLVGDKPLVFYAIKQLLEADIKDILLSIDDQHASQFMQLLQDGSHLGIRSLAYIWQPREGKGIPLAISQAAPFIDGKMVVVCGDVIIENGITKPVKDFLKQTQGARLTATHLKDTAGYSPLQTTPKRVLNILPKDKERHQPGLIDLGIYMYQPEVFERIKQLKPSARGETEIWDLNKTYTQQGQLAYTAVEGWWSDVGGSIKTYLEAYEHYKK